MAGFSLDIDMNTTTGFETFLQGLEDSTVRAGVLAQRGAMPPAATQLAAMMDDARFMALATDAVQRYQEFSASGSGDSTAVMASGQALNAYIKRAYPDAVQALQKYAESISPELRADATATRAAKQPVRAAVRVEVAANLLAIANAVVVSNVAIATNVAVALEAVAIIGVFVII